MNNEKALAVLTTLILTIAMFALISIPVRAQNGPKIDRLRLKVIRSPDAQVSAMITREIDMLNGMIRPGDVEKLADEGKIITSTSGFHMCNFIYNIRPYLLAGPHAGEKNPLHNVNFRHALAHLIPKDQIVGSLFRYINIKLDAMVPLSMSAWHNGEVDDHPFSDPAVYGANAEAVKILEDAGYTHTGTWPNYVWSDPDGDPLTPIRVYIPLIAVAPTSYKVGEMWVEKIHAIGLTNVELTAMEFSPYIVKMYDEWDFEVGWTCYLLGRFPDYLYDMMYSGENYKGSSNPSGIYWPALDVELETLKYGLDRAEMITASKRAQMLVAGGNRTTASERLPHNAPTDDNHWNWSLVRLPVYNRNYYDSAQPELAGLVNARGWGTDILATLWSAVNMHWSVDPATIGRVDPDGSTFVIVNVDEYPERMNPLWSKTVYAAIFYQGFEGLISVNPWSHADIPWIAKDWEYTDVSGDPGYPAGVKMAVKFWLRDDVYWQTGEQFTIDDVKFSWEFIRDWQIPKYWYFSQYIDSVVTDPVENSVTALMTRTSAWDFYDLAGTAALLHHKVWEKNPVTGNPWTDVAEIVGFDPAQQVDPGNYYIPGNNIPTYLYGTGPFIFKGYYTGPAYGDLDANRNYWQTTAELEALIEEMFWRSGDTDRSGKIYAEDTGLVGLPGVWDQKAMRLRHHSYTETSWDAINNAPGVLNARVGRKPDRNPGGDDFIEEDTNNTQSQIFNFTVPIHGSPGETSELALELIDATGHVLDNDYYEVHVIVDGGADQVISAEGNLHKKWQLKQPNHATGYLFFATVSKDAEHTVDVYLVKKTNGADDWPAVGSIILEVFDFEWAADFTGALAGPPDGKTDADDLYMAARFFGETITTTWPTP